MDSEWVDFLRELQPDTEGDICTAEIVPLDPIVCVGCQLRLESSFPFGNLCQGVPLGRNLVLTVG